MLDDTLIFYLLGDNGASGEGGPRGTFREHLVGHGIQDDTADMAARLDALGDPTTYAIYPAGWALAMNTPYPWTKQIAHLGGTRDGMIVRWGNGIAARGEVRHQWHHVIDVLPTILEATGLPAPDSVGGVTQQPIEGTSLRYTFDDAGRRRTGARTQYFEMIGNRGDLPRGLDRRHPPRHPVGDGRHRAPSRSTRTSGSSTTTQPTGARRTTSPTEHPERLREPAGALRPSRRRSTTSSRSTTGSPSARTRRWPAASTSTTAGRRCRSAPASDDSPRRPRRTSRTARTSSPPTSRCTPGPAGWSSRRAGASAAGRSYCLGGVPAYAYNFVGRDLVTVRAAEPMEPGRHDLVVRFDYDGGPPGSGADVVIEVDGSAVAWGRIPVTTAYYFSFDETFNIGVDRGTPVIDDYPPVRNRFEGVIHRVRFDLADIADPGTADGRGLAVMVHQ